MGGIRSSAVDGPSRRRGGLRFATAALAALSLVGSLVVFDASPAQAANPSLDTDQCANGAPIDPANCNTDAGDWINGNLGTGNSTYAEGGSVAYRGMFSNLTIGSTYFVDVKYDTTKGGAHAFDYLTSFNRTVTTANPCAGLALAVCDPGVFLEVDIPADPQVTGEGVTPVPQTERRFRTYGASDLVVSGYTYPDGAGFAGDKSAVIRLTFKATKTTPVIAWGGHIATRFDWAPAATAANIPGSAYHMSTTGSGGNGGEHSLSAAAVILPSSLTVEKDASPNTANSFGFIGTGSQVTPAFSLTDNGGTNSVTFNFATVADFNQKTITEGADAGGYALTDITCVLDPDSQGTSGASDAGRVATINVSEGQDYTCTFTNTQQNGTLRVIKQASPALPSAFSLHVQQNGVEVATSPQPGSATGTVYTLPGGTYDVFETGGPAGYTSNDAGCAGGSPVVVPAQETVCTITNTAGTLSLDVDKTADPTSINEPGPTNVNYTVVVTNNSAEAVTLSSVVDSAYPDITGDADCHAGANATVLAANGGSCTITYTKPVSGNAGTSVNNEITVGAVDDEQRPVSDFDDATVTINNVDPTVTITKEATPTTLPEPGGEFSFELTVTNTSPESVTITALTDSDGMSQECLDLIGDSLAPGASTSCTNTETHTNAGSYDDTASVTVADNDPGGLDGTDSVTETVTVTNVDPTVSITKSADPASLPEPGGVFTFTLTIQNTSPESVTISALSDTQGLSQACLDLVGDSLAPQGQQGDSTSCTYTISHTNAGSYPNTASVTVTDNDPGGNDGSDTDDETVTVTDTAPTVSITKSADPSSLPEPGGVFTFTLTIQNTSPESVTISALSDTQALSQACMDLVGDSLAPFGQQGDTTSCTYTISHTNAGSYPNTASVTVTDNDPGGIDGSDTDDETVTVTDTAPTVSLTKSADPTSLPEPGGVFTFTLTIQNTSPESVTISALSDTQALSQACMDLVGDSLAPFGQQGDTTSCTYTISHTDAGSYPNTASVTVTDNDPGGTDGSDTDDETVTVTNEQPSVEIDKSVTPGSLPEPGGDFEYTITITNTSPEPVEIISLTDAQGLPQDCLDLIGDTLAPAGETGDEVSCSYIITQTNAGEYENTASVVVEDNEGSTADDSDTETVTVTNVDPTVSITKEAAWTTLQEPGGIFVFMLTITNTSPETVTIDSLTDDNTLSQECLDLIGTELAPADEEGDSVSCSYTVEHTNVGEFDNTATVVVSDDDEGGEDGTDSADATVEVTNVDPTVSITKEADPDSLPEPGGDFEFTLTITNESPETVTIDSLTDDNDLSEECLDLIGTELAPGGDEGSQVSCTYTVEHTNAGVYDNTATVVVSDDDEGGEDGTDSADARVEVTNVDPTVSITKDADPDSLPEPGGDFEFTLTITNESPETVTIDSLTDDNDLSEECLALVGTELAPAGEEGDSVSCTYTVAHTNAGVYDNTATVVVSDDDEGGDDGTDSADARVEVTNVDPTVSITKEADPDSLPEPGGDFEFTLTITNTSPETVTIDSLTDDNDLSEECLALVGTELAPAGEEGDSVSCTYTVTHTDSGEYDNTATVVVSDDDEGGEDGTDSADATVTVTEVAPDIAVTKTADPDHVPENNGGPVEYTVTITNNGVEPVTLTSLGDEPFGEQVGDPGCEVAHEEDGEEIPATVLEVGESCSFTYTGAVPPGEFGGDPFVNTITVTVTDDDESTDTEKASAEVTYDPVAHLTVEKVPCPVLRTVSGGFLTYTITAGNDGNAPAVDPVLVDTVPEGTVVVDEGGGVVSEDGTTVTWELDDIAVGETVEEKIVVRVDAPNGSVLENNVTLSATGVDDATDTTLTPVSNEGAAATGSAYGADVRLLGSSIIGGPLGAVSSSAPPNDADVNEVLGAPLPPIAVVNVLRQTSTAIVENSAIGQGTSTTAKVNLLGGLVTADAVKAVSTSFAGPLFATSTGLGSTFVNLRINGKQVANSAPNTKVDIKLAGLTIAKAVLMETTGAGTNGPPMATATGQVNMIHVTLLAPLLGFQKGAEIIVGHAESFATYPSGAACGVTGAAVFAEAYTAAAQGRLDGQPVVTVKQGDAVIGANGGFDFDEILGLDLSPLLTSATGRNTASGSLAPKPNATARAITEGLNLFGGRITGDVIDVSSTSKYTGSTPGTTFTSKLVNLKIGTTPIDPNASPNTTLAIPGPGGSILLVIINEQVTAGNAFNTFGVVNALHVYVLKGGLLELEVIVGHAASGTHVDAPAP